MTTYGRIPTAVLDHLHELSGPQALVYLGLAAHLGKDTWQVWPSQERLAELLGISRRSVRRHLAGLEGVGLIEHVGKRGRVDVYSLAPRTNLATVDKSGHGTGRAPVAKRARPSGQTGHPGAPGREEEMKKSGQDRPTGQKWPPDLAEDPTGPEAAAEAWASQQADLAAVAALSDEELAIHRQAVLAQFRNGTLAEKDPRRHPVLVGLIAERL